MLLINIIYNNLLITIIYRKRERKRKGPLTNYLLHSRIFSVSSSNCLLCLLESLTFSNFWNPFLPHHVTPHNNHILCYKTTHTHTQLPIKLTFSSITKTQHYLYKSNYIKHQIKPSKKIANYNETNKKKIESKPLR